MEKCAICQQEKTVQTLMAQDDDGENYAVKICDRCWDAIYGIAMKAAENVLRKELRKVNNP